MTTQRGVKVFSNGWNSVYKRYKFYIEQIKHYKSHKFQICGIFLPEVDGEKTLTTNYYVKNSKVPL